MTITQRRILAALFAFGMIATFATATFAQTVSLTSNLYVVSESDGEPLVQIVLDQPAGTTVTASYSYQAGTAEFQSDFYVAEGVMIWAPGQSGPRRVDVFITDDQVVESDEEFTFLVTSVEAATMGIPSTATIRIIDNDSANPPGATFFDPSLTPFGDDQTSVITAEPTTAFRVGVRLSRIPEAPLLVRWESELTIGVQSLIFDGVREQIISLTAPWEGSVRSFGTDILADGLAPENPALERRHVVLMVVPSPPSWENRCVSCFANYILGVLEREGCWPECQYSDCPEKMGQATKHLSTFEVLQRYRDEILAGTPTGQFYIDLYEELSAELGWIVVKNLDMLWNLQDMEATWIPAFEGLVNGHGDAYYIVGPMQAQLSQLFDDMESGATGDLASTLAFERDRLGLDAVDGMNMDELQAHLEANGGVDVPHTSWGTVKAHYGGH